MNNVITFVSKKMVLSLVMGVMLLGLTGYAKKRSYDEGPGASSNEPASKVQRGDTASDVSEGRPVAADGATAGSVAPQGGDTYVGIHEALTCSFFSAAEPSQDPDDLQLVIGSERVIIPQSDFRSWCEQCLDAMNRRMTRSTVRTIKEQLEGVLTRVFAALQEEGEAINRARAQNYAQRFLSGQPVEVRLLFAIVADYLMSNFLSVVGWYSLAQEERTALSEIPFYAWELALQQHSLIEITHHDLDLHLLNATPDRACYDDPYHYIGLVLLSQTGKDEGHLARKHFDILKWLTKTEVLGQEEIVRFFAEITELNLNKMFGFYGCPSKDTFTYLFDIAAFLPSLTSLRLSSLRFDEFNPRRWEILRGGLARISCITKLDLSETNLSSLTTENLALLGGCLGPMRQLKTLNLAGNDLGMFSLEKLRILLNTLEAMPDLAVLSLSSNNLIRLDAEKLGFLMNGLRGILLASLSLRSNRLGDLDEDRLYIIMRSLTRLPLLKKLDLSGNNLDRLDAHCLPLLMSGLVSLHLEELDLSVNNLGNMITESGETARVVMNSLQQMQSLKVLNLSVNFLERLGGERWHEMMHSLASIEGLTTLNLASNNLYSLRHDEWQIILDSLSNMPRLTTLNLTHNFIEAETLQRIREVFAGEIIIE